MTRHPSDLDMQIDPTQFQPCTVRVVFIMICVVSFMMYFAMKLRNGSAVKMATTR